MNGSPHCVAAEGVGKLKAAVRCRSRWQRSDPAFSPGYLFYQEMKTAPVRGPLGLIPIVVVAFDDYPPVVTVPIEVAMEAAVTVTELGACAAAEIITVTELGTCTPEIITVTELASMTEMVTVTADANTNAKVLSTGDARCRNGNSRERCKRNTKLSHVPSSHSCPRENGGTESQFLRSAKSIRSTAGDPSANSRPQSAAACFTSTVFDCNIFAFDEARFFSQAGPNREGRQMPEGTDRKPSPFGPH
jgi:hypothetical protein